MTRLLIALSILAALGVADTDHAPRPLVALDATTDTLRIAPPAWPAREGSCFAFERWVVVAWGSPGPGERMFLARPRDPETDLGHCDCTTDSLAGDFVLRGDGTAEFVGVWKDLLFLDEGTGLVRGWIGYDIPSGERVLDLWGISESEGWVDDTTLRFWMLAGQAVPPELCPDIPPGFAAAAESLYTLDLETLRLTALGPWRCRAMN